MKRIALLMIGIAAVAVVATAKLRGRPAHPEAPSGTWDVAPDTDTQ